MNFEFLKSLNGVNVLYESCRNAESFVKEKPDVSCTEARKAMEYIVKLIYTTAIDSDINGLTVFQMMTDSRFVDYVDAQQLIDAMHFIRKYGNHAVHSGGISSDTALQVLQYLHLAVGELCISLGLISSYPKFSSDFLCAQSIHPEIQPQEIFFDPVAVLSFSSKLSTVRHISQIRPIQDVHVSPQKAANMKRGSGVDSGANTKTAFQIVASGMAGQFGEEAITANYTKQILSFPVNSTRKVLAVKTGCSILGNKNCNGDWEILPGIDYILYAPDLNNLSPLEDQLHIFTRDEFLAMWEENQLIRKKISTSARKRYQKLYGADFRFDIDKHADVISVQSFTNSGRKYPAVMAHCCRFPTLASVGYAYFAR